MEGHVNPRNGDNGTLPRGAVLGVIRQRIQPRFRTGHCILSPGDIVVDHLKELARLRGHARDVGEGFGRAHPHLVRTQRRQIVERLSSGIALDQMVHGQPADINDVQDRLQGQDLGIGGQGVVLAHRVASEEGTTFKDLGFFKRCNLCAAQRGHGHLRELRQIQHAIRVREGLTSHHHGVGVVADDLQDGEAQALPRVLIRTLPHGARRCGFCIVLHPHPRGLDALAREGVKGGRAAHRGPRLQHRHALAGGGHAADLAVAAALVNTHPFHLELHLTAGKHGCKPGNGPLEDASAVESHGCLRQRRGPHAVDDRALTMPRQCRSVR